MNADELIKIYDNVDGFDLMQIKCHLDWFSVKYDQDESINCLKHVLSKFILTEILKAGVVNVEHYTRKLRESISFLQAHSAAGYPCFLVGCRFSGRDHQKYIRHVKSCHPNSCNILCNFKKVCLRRFLNIEDLLHHIKNKHSKIAGNTTQSAVALPPLDVGCKCDRLSCGNRKFSNTQELMKHYNSFHATEDRYCIFAECNVKFKSSCPKSALNHFRIKHKQTGHLTLKPMYLLQSANNAAEFQSPRNFSDLDRDAYDAESDIGTGLYDVPDLAGLDDENLEAQASENDAEYYLEFYADFLNRLCHVKFVPQSTIQEIVEELIRNSRKSLNRQEILLRKMLVQKGIEKIEIDEIIKKVIEEDPFLKAQETLNSEYKRNRFIQELDLYAKPEEIVLNKAEVLKGNKKDVYHYVPIIKSLIALHNDKTFQDVVQRNRRPLNSDIKIKDIKDGQHYSNNPFFQAYPDAYGIMMYSDAVEIVNPLGAARGTYKVVQIFFTLCDIDKSQRAKIDRLQLAMIFREKLLKKYSLKTILQPLVRDLKHLEEGVHVANQVSSSIKAGLVCYIADNLEAAIVGGFSSNFSSKDICRICHYQYDDLDSEVYKDSDYWTVAEYDSICASNAHIVDNRIEDNNGDEVFHQDFIFTTGDSEGSSSEDDDESGSEEADERTSTSRGINLQCPFNILDSFHCVSGFPLDLMHDCFEGK